MSYFDAIILGLIQGLTEFIPISSSGHLILIRELFGLENGGLIFDVALHLGTLLAVLIYFRKDILGIVINFKENQKLFWMLVIGTVPAVIAGVFFADFVESLGEDGLVAALFLIVTAFILIIAEKKYKKYNKKELRPQEKMTYKDALVIGLMQMFALLPGISRSGITIATGFMRGVERKNAARFSFLLSIPAIAGAGVYTTVKAVESSGHVPLSGPMAVGFIASFVSGFLAIRFLMKYLERNTFFWFSTYLLIVGVFLIGLFFFS